MPSSAKVYWDLLNCIQVTEPGGARDVPIPVLSYQSLTSIRFEFVDVDPDTATTTPVDVSDAVSWRAAVGDGYDPTALLAQITDSDIDDTDAATGVIVVTVDCGDAGFLAAVTGQREISAYMDVYGENAGGTEIISVRALKVKARMSIDPL